MSKKKTPVSKSPTPPVAPKKELSFPEAMKAVINGEKITRLEWGKTDEYGELRENFLMLYRNGKFHTWIVSEGDLLAMDWVTL